jgi:hypothetical protein
LNQNYFKEEENNTNYSLITNFEEIKTLEKEKERDLFVCNKLVNFFEYV